MMTKSKTFNEAARERRASNELGTVAAIAVIIASSLKGDESYEEADQIYLFDVQRRAAMNLLEANNKH